MSEANLEAPDMKPVTLARLLLAPLRAWTSRGRDAAYVDFAARPWSAVLVTLLYCSSLGLINFLLNHYVRTGDFAISHTQTSSVFLIVIIWLLYFGISAVVLPLYGSLVRFGLHKVMGGGMPVEKAPLGAPTGVWLSLAWAAPMLCLALLLCGAMVVQPWLPVLVSVGKAGLGTLGFVAYVIPLQNARMIYGIPLRGTTGRRLSLIMLTPPILIAVVGMVLAIALGLQQKHKQMATTMPNLSSSKVGMPAAPAQGQQHVNGQIDPDYLYSPRVAVHPDVAPYGTKIMAVVPKKHKQMETTMPNLSPSKVDMSAAPAQEQNQAAMNCNGRGPMLMPLAPQELGASVIGVVSSSEALAAIEQGQQHVNGQIDPDYLYSPRVALHPDAAPYGTNIMAVVPTGMTVTPGQHISYTTGYADSNRPCFYFPNLVKNVDEH